MTFNVEEPLQQLRGYGGPRMFDSLGLDCTKVISDFRERDSSKSMRELVVAIEQVRKMRGGAQSHLMRCRYQSISAEHYWVVKFQNNPQHIRVLANELLVTRIAGKIGLPVPVTAPVEVSDSLIDNTAELKHELAGRPERCSSGLQFGAQYVVDPKEGQVYDYLPSQFLNRVKNLRDFLGMLCVDKWTGNADGRQAVYWRHHRERQYSATFIDQGHCFNAGEWDFEDSPLRGIYANNAVYATVTGWESFEPWLSRIQSLSIEELWRVAESVPPEWYENDNQGLERLIEQLWKRKERVSELIHQFKTSSRTPFPFWKTKVAMLD